MPLFVLRNGNLVRVETIASQEREIPFGQIIDSPFHVVNFLFGDDDLRHIAQLLVDQLGKALGIDRVIAVKECIFYLSARISLKNVVLTAEGVGVVISKMMNYLLHKP